jgi:hypothetical protein
LSIEEVERDPAGSGVQADGTVGGEGAVVGVSLSRRWSRPARLQVGGFSSRAEAQRALQHKLARLVTGGRSATITLEEWVVEYLEAH